MKLMKTVSLLVLCITTMIVYVNLALASSDSQTNSDDPMLKPYSDKNTNLEGRVRSPLSCDEQRLAFGPREGGGLEQVSSREKVSALLEGESTDSGSPPHHKSQGSKSTGP